MTLTEYIYKIIQSKNEYINLNDLSNILLKIYSQRIKFIKKLFILIFDLLIYYNILIIDTIIYNQIKIILLIVKGLCFKFENNTYLYISEIIFFISIIINYLFLCFFPYSQLYHNINGQNLKIMVIYNIIDLLIKFLNNLKFNNYYLLSNTKHFSLSFTEIILFLIINVITILVHQIQIICINVILNLDYNNLFVILFTLHVKEFKNSFKRFNYEGIKYFLLNSMVQKFNKIVYVVIIYSFDDSYINYNEFVNNICLFFIIEIIFFALFICNICLRNYLTYKELNAIINELKNKLYISLNKSKVNKYNDKFEADECGINNIKILKIFEICKKDYIFINQNLKKSLYMNSFNKFSYLSGLNVTGIANIIIYYLFNNQNIINLMQNNINITILTTIFYLININYFILKLCNNSYFSFIIDFFKLNKK